MDNPWLRIPASDYEGHMGSPKVAQLAFLGQIFKEALDRYDCTALALLGSATGNGLEHVSSRTTRRLTAVDINPQYLEILRQRYGERLPGLEIVAADLERCELDQRAYTLIFAGLIFEYLDPERLLGKIAGWLAPQGVLAAVLQVNDRDREKVTETPYSSLKLLGPVMRLVEPDRFKTWAQKAGLNMIREEMRVLETGKSFYTASFR